MRNFVKVLDVKNDGVMLEDMPLIEVSREELPLGQEWFDAFKEKNN